ncbi:uncharacterized protein MELLADRAFT_109947 [Melampsora larici-populina 98AG31]|uniref:C3H1-type domain-containing protein n=1 Tax=Melampsora larici-populina (strain 98AG31 / pathotype 3-4-7) TaxID=747676 RepID=F4RY53_MELLP|nr:uncharacterized protein MELLADRAFT_109947 [Melampsora larici-populina 98AG31]EGG02700.1 hypothetical protein MELLADRAFT_109947 [Melampsora larici-populina 98AG31]
MVINNPVTLTNATTAIFDDIDKILTNYDDSGGSKVTTMAQFRTQVASVYSYEDPDFLFHFSAVARCAISLDSRANRPVYPVTDVLPAVADPQVIPPIVLSDRFSPPPTIDIYGPVKGFMARPIPSSPSRFEDLSMFPANPSTNSGGPPPPPPQPSSPRLRRGPVSHANCSPRASPRGPDAGPSLLRRIQFSGSPRARTPCATTPIFPVFERLDKGKRKRTPASPPSSHSSARPPVAAPAVSGPTFLSGIPTIPGPMVPAQILTAPYMDDNEHLVPEDFTPISFHVNQIALLYKSDIKHHVSAFNSCKNRPANWQNSLTKELLECNFVDLRKFYGAVASSDPPQSRLCINADGDLNNVEGAAPKEITDNTHWQNLLGVLKHAYIAAFPPAAISIKKYFEYILRLPGLFQARVYWEDVRDFDVELRKEFASRPSLVWGDYTHDSLKGIDNRVLYSSTSKLGRASIPTQKYQSVQSSSRTPRLAIEAAPPSYQSSRPSAAKKQKGKRNKPAYKIRDSRSLPKADQPCNNWNLGVCPHSDDSCERVHGVCNKDGCFEHHQGSDAHK